jgi:hypothetical protein
VVSRAMHASDVSTIASSSFFPPHARMRTVPSGSMWWISVIILYSMCQCPLSTPNACAITSSASTSPHDFIPLSFILKTTISIFLGRWNQFLNPYTMGEGLHICFAWKLSNATIFGCLQRLTFAQNCVDGPLQNFVGVMVCFVNSCKLNVSDKCVMNLVCPDPEGPTRKYTRGGLRSMVSVGGTTLLIKDLSNSACYITEPPCAGCCFCALLACPAFYWIDVDCFEYLLTNTCVFLGPDHERDWRVMTHHTPNWMLCCLRVLSLSKSLSLSDFCVLSFAGMYSFW